VRENTAALWDASVSENNNTLSQEKSRQD